MDKPTQSRGATGPIPNPLQPGATEWVCAPLERRGHTKPRGQDRDAEAAVAVTSGEALRRARTVAEVGAALGFSAFHSRTPTTFRFDLSKARSLAGVDASSPAPDGNRLDRDKNPCAFAEHQGVLPPTGCWTDIAWRERPTHYGETGPLHDGPWTRVEHALDAERTDDQDDDASHTRPDTDGRARMDVERAGSFERRPALEGRPLTRPMPRSTESTVPRPELAHRRHLPHHTLAHAGTGEVNVL